MSRNAMDECIAAVNERDDQRDTAQREWAEAVAPRLPARKTVRNFTQAQTLETAAHDYSSSDIGDKIVTLSSSGGSCRFQFDMLPEQARELAAHLLECAEALEVAV